MRLALVTLLGLGLALGQAAAQDNQRLIDLANQLSISAENLKVQQAGVPQRSSKKVGERILKSLLTDGETERAANDPIFERFQDSAAVLASRSRDLARRRADIGDERAFIRQFRETERLAMDADRALTNRAARDIMVDEVKPTLRDIRREMRTLTSWRDDDRRDFYRRDAGRL
jgi:hypothetical protein